MISRTVFSGGLCALVGMLAVATMAMAAQRAGADTPAAPMWLSCPDSLTLDMRPDRDRDPNRIRDIAPKAGAQTSQELYTHARLAGVAYDLYGVFDAGRDPRTAFNVPGLRLVSIIYGDPGPETERRPRGKDTRTLYGFVADETATGRRYIVFRGTEQPAEWVRNMQVGQRPYPAGTSARAAIAHVHAGFLQIFESLKLDGATTPLAGALPGLVVGRDTIFVGHSLGSALATLAGVEASIRAPQSAARVRIVTLASPRVGDTGFAVLARAVGRIDRVCNLVDIVTAVPPSTPQGRYVHVGAPYRVSSFDWPGLANDLAKKGDQILCWHGDASYAVMLQPAIAPREASQCFKPTR